MKQNAVILILCRNSDLDGISKSLHDFEDTFNKKYGYPYVFLNNDDFTEEFKTAISHVISTKAEYGKVEGDAWGMPSWIDEVKATAAMQDLKNRNVIYGGDLSYHNMCRFFSGFFYKHELVKKYEYYWRIEPDVSFFCKMNYDPFEYMKTNNKKYGFVMVVREFMETIPTLWKVVIEFLEQNRNLIDNYPILGFIFDENKNYNGCHFWSNFEIASFDFFRNELYEKYFEFLDKNGGFYYERWGDAPVHSIAVSLFIQRDQIEYFEDIGYRHSLYQHCPKSPSRLVDCKCSPKDNLEATTSFTSCTNDYIRETLK